MEAEAKPKRVGRPRKTPPKPPPGTPVAEPIQFEPLGARTISGQIEKMLLSSKDPVDLKELACAFLEEVGGSRGFIKKMMKNFNDPATSVQERTRIMEFGAKLMQVAYAKDQQAEPDQMSEEDLELQARILMMKIGVPGVREAGWVYHVCI